jgi:anthranilate synthase component 1
MQIEPAADEFAARYARGQPQVVWTTLVGDLETPVSAFLKVAGGRANSFLFESVEGGAVRGRYSIIGLDPDVIWRTIGTRAEINRAARSKNKAFTPCPEAPLAALRALIAESRIALPDKLPSMVAGLFGYLGYDMVRLMEELPAPNPDPVGLADAILLRPTVVIVFDAVLDAITVVTPVRPEPNVTAAAAFSRASERQSRICASALARQGLSARRTHAPPRTRCGTLRRAAPSAHDGGGCGWQGWPMHRARQRNDRRTGCQHREN